MKLVVTLPSRYMIRQVIRLFRRYKAGVSLEARDLLMKSVAFPAAGNATVDQMKRTKAVFPANVEPPCDACKRFAASSSNQNESRSDWVVTSPDEEMVALPTVDVENRENRVKSVIANTKWGIRRSVVPPSLFDRHDSAHLAKAGLRNSTVCSDPPPSPGTMG